MKKSVLATRFENRNKFENEVRLSVSGSRTLDDERVKILILEAIEKYNITRIVTHAEPEGVCGVARRLCKEKGIPLTLHFLNFKYNRGVFYQRTIAVFMDTDIALFIHDGKSKGTSNEYEVAMKMMIQNEYYELEVSEHKSSIGFDVEDGEWITYTEEPMSFEDI